MLSVQSAATLRATLPAVGAALDEITERFYAGMFAARPELLRDLFNRGNQAAGTQRQALAGSIAAFATHLLEHPDERPDAMLQRIAHKHASLGITPEQYAIVHEHLFAAIADVLGEAVTPEVAAAWDEVYWLMANALVAIEKRLYEERGGAGWRPWEVVARVAETADVVTFRLRPADGGPVRDFRPGQYVSVRVALADGARQIRQYSLSGAPAPDERQFTVKRVRDEAAPEGEVSGHLYARVRAGDVVELSEPYGDLVLDAATDTPLLLASAGIGVTPMTAMLAHLAETGHRAPVTVVHGDRSPADHALRTDHEAYAAKLPDAAVHFWYEQDAPAGAGTGYVDLTRVPVASGTRAYLCGPLPFMRMVRRQLIGKGVAPADIHYEVFGPDLWLAGAAA
ncbi:globin domain-containing protein [Streptomyces sp. NPDC012461]|jgi:nitric oxide dioxygenase|uniref:nitric oxide dioxygenase n=2 Tax=unclassified Streptomyces TaxID=2593676 RepID=A0A6G3QVB4_9ACTN|nr:MULTISPECIES: globin domain-containing protein [unclassified Streptomyces]MBM7088546.1 hemin transporter [Streptomyces sp. S12]NEA87439.1 hemin transporter [Streptomyces sp. SID14436]NEC81802.1 hemin transporter [Streptomyces sp. SID7958]NED21348.1 hemin transporter [Streptomyces sp. SID9913]